MLIRLVDNMDAGFSLYSAAVLGCSYLQSLEKEQKFANLINPELHIPQEPDCRCKRKSQKHFTNVFISKALFYFCLLTKKGQQKHVF